MTANKVAMMLRSKGFKIGKVSEADEVEDGEVELLDLGFEAHVQVGATLWIHQKNVELSS